MLNASKCQTLSTNYINPQRNINLNGQLQQTMTYFSKPERNETQDISGNKRKYEIFASENPTIASALSYTAVSVMKETLLIWVAKGEKPEERLNRTIAMLDILNAYQKNSKILDLSKLELTDLPPVLNQLISLTTIYLNHNNLVKLEYDIFSGLVNLKEINLFGNKLTKIEQNVFKGLTNLMLLDMRNNLLNKICPGIFAGADNLQCLLLGNNMLPSLPVNTFPSNLEELDLSGNMLTDLSNMFIFNNLAKLKSLDISNNHIYKLSHVIFYHLPQLVSLDMSNNVHIRQLPYRIFYNAKNLSELILKNIGLYEAPRKLIKNLVDLTYLDLGYNELALLSKEYFSECRPELNINLDGDSFPITMIEEIGLDNQVIVSAPSTAAILEMTNKLQSWAAKKPQENYNRKIASRHILVAYQQNSKILDLSKLGLTDLPSELNQLINVTIIYLNHNNLVKLESGLFNNMFKLKKLYVSNNKLTKIESNALMGLTNLELLDMRNNLLNKVLPGTFDKTKNLQCLLLGNNHLKSLLENTFPSSLKKLDLSGNRLTDLLDKFVFKNLAKLQLLDISNNHIRIFSDDIFYSLLQLSDLDISKNVHIRQLPDDMFCNATNLTRLNLSNIGLHEISLRLIENLVHLNYLDLSDNELTLLPKGYFNNCKPGTKINLCGNSFLESLANQISLEYRHRLELSID